MQGQGTECVADAGCWQLAAGFIIWSMCWGLFYFQVKRQETSWVEGTISKICPNGLVDQNESLNSCIANFPFTFLKRKKEKEKMQRMALMTGKKYFKII